VRLTVTYFFPTLIHTRRGSTREGSHASALTRNTGNTKGGSISVLLTSCVTGLDYTFFQIKTKIVSCYIANSKPVKQEVNGTVILPPLVFPEKYY